MPDAAFARPLMRLCRLSALAALAWTLSMAWPALAAEPAEESTLILLNREIVTLRAPLAGASPQTRVDRALKRIAELPPAAYDRPLQALPFSLGDARGVQVLLGDEVLFSLLDADVDPEARRQGLPALTQQTLARLEATRSAWHAMRDDTLLWRGLGRAALTTVAILAIGWAVAWGTRRGTAWLEVRRRALARSGGQVDWRELLARLLASSIRLLQWLLFAVIGYAWVRLVLGSFVATEPLADRLGGWWVGKLLWVLDGLAAGLPGLVTVAIVVVLTRALADVLGYFFDAVQRGRLQPALVHPETAPATRRIVTGLVWVAGLAIAYPYLPGASSDAFKGLSVLVGLMVTLGSTGIVTQAMSGLVVIYARALRRGDYVKVGEVEGVVTEVAPLATKLLNLRNEEITIPNSVLVSSPIHNFSRQVDTQGTLLSTRLTIGYDTSWRQVHALLAAAALATAGVRRDPPPRVYQRALSDFYVEYELMLSIERPIDRIPLLSDLHANILDAFNEASVQIMSPHYFVQPAHAVVVPPGPHAASP